MYVSTRFHRVDIEKQAIEQAYRVSHIQYSGALMIYLCVLAYRDNIKKERKRDDCSQNRLDKNVN